MTSEPDNMVESAVYDRQFKFVHALLKQAPTHTAPTSARAPVDWGSRFVQIRRPDTGVASLEPTRQGPFLLSPAPEESEDGDDEASDIIYVLSSSAPKERVEDSNLEPRDSTQAKEENLGVILVAFGSGMVHIGLDTDKVHGLWDVPHAEVSSAMLARVFEMWLMQGLERILANSDNIRNHRSWYSNRGS